MTRSMKLKGIDVPVEFMAMLDAQVRLFEGDYSFTELLHMDIPLKRSLVLGRLANLERSQRKLEESGQVDQFSKKDAGIQTLGKQLGGLLG